jgi:hypothetical protein
MPRNLCMRVGLFLATAAILAAGYADLVHPIRVITTGVAFFDFRHGQHGLAPHDLCEGTNSGRWNVEHQRVPMW